MPDTHPLLIVPGFKGSEAGHWQERWEVTFPDAKLVNQADWHRPSLAGWLDNLRIAVKRRPGSILVGHSLGSILITHFITQFRSADVAGVLLVAPADVEREDCRQFSEFAPVPRQRLRVPAIVVASTNDPFMRLARAQEFSQGWGAQTVVIPNGGHINVAAGFGDWPDGETILRQLRRDIRARHGEVANRDAALTGGSGREIATHGR
jgi:predicted alpha/beta hydrolase family esterase